MRFAFCSISFAYIFRPAAIYRSLLNIERSPINRYFSISVSSIWRKWKRNKSVGNIFRMQDIYEECFGCIAFKKFKKKKHLIGQFYRLQQHSVDCCILCRSLYAALLPCVWDVLCYACRVLIVSVKNLFSFEIAVNVLQLYFDNGMKRMSAS